MLHRAWTSGFETIRRHDLLTAFLGVIAAFLVRWFFLKSLGDEVPFLVFYPALTIAAIVGGLRAGLLATVLAALIADFFWLGPPGSLSLDKPSYALAILFFLISGALISLVGELLHRANRKLQAAASSQQLVLTARVAAATAALAESERRFRTALAGSPVSIWEQDLDLKYTWFWNPKLGYAHPDVIGKTDSDLMDPTCLAQLEAVKRQAIMSAQPARRKVAIAAPGAPFQHFDLYVEPRLDAQQRVVGITCVGIDISEHHALEQELETRVQTAVAAREAAQNRLQHAQRLEALGQLAGGIAHDFNNVLSAVQGGARLMKERADDPERVSRIARMIDEATARGTSITRRLLTFARQADLVTEAIDATALLEGLLEILSHTLGSGITVAVDVEAGLPPFMADKGQLETVLVNLATNARDALHGAGTIRLTATLDELAQDDGPSHPVKLRAGAYARLSVIDDGMGMTPEVLARACEPFFTTKKVGQGTGLGLAMARGFAEQSGGGLHIDSDVGRGTTVALWFPVAPASPSSAG